MATLLSLAQSRHAEGGLTLHSVIDSSRMQISFGGTQPAGHCKCFGSWLMCCHGGSPSVTPDFTTTKHSHRCIFRPQKLHANSTTQAASHTTAPARQNGIFCAYTTTIDADWRLASMRFGTAASHVCSLSGPSCATLLRSMSHSTLAIQTTACHGKLELNPSYV